MVSVSRIISNAVAVLIASRIGNLSPDLSMELQTGSQPLQMCQLDLLSALVVVHFSVCSLSLASGHHSLPVVHLPAGSAGPIPRGASDLGQVPSHCASCPLVNAKYAPIKQPGKCLILPLLRDHGQKFKCSKKGKPKGVQNGKRSQPDTARIAQ